MTRKVYECHKKIGEKHVYIKRLGTFDFEITLDNKPIIVQSSNPFDLMRLIEECLRSASGQTQFAFDEYGDPDDPADYPEPDFNQPFFNKFGEKK